MPRGNAGEPRKRSDPDAVMRRNQEIIRRHKRGESPRVIERATGVARMTCWRVVEAWKKSQGQAADEDEDFDALPSALSKMTESERLEWDLAETLRELDEDPANALALFRLGHLPRSLPGHPWGVAQ